MSEQNNQIYTSYVASRDPDGTVGALYRFQRSATAISTAYLQDGQWIEKGSLLWSVFHNLHEVGFEEISDEEAAEIAAPYGVIIPISPQDLEPDNDMSSRA